SVDYGRETNRLERHVLEPGAAQAITLEVGKGYWIDWYGDGHTYNNWESQYSGAHPAAELLPVAETDDARPITVNLPDTTRSVMLNGGTSSAWKGELLSGGSVAGTY